MRENRRRKREGRTYGRSLHFCPLLDLLVAFAIGWLSLATREADTSAGGEGWPPRRHEDGGGEVGKLRRGGWLTERVSQPGRKGWRSSNAAVDDNDDDDGRQCRWLSREDRRHSE